MRIVIAEEIFKILKLEKTSDNYQKIYKIGDLILKDSDDYFVYETAINRGLVEEKKCKICGKKKDRTYSSNGVFDGESCPNEDITGKHK